MASIKGLTLEIAGDTTLLTKALGDVNSKSKSLQSELKEVEKLLKLDPTNTELLTQKQTLLAQSIQSAKEKLDTLKTAAEQAAQKLASGDIGEDQYRALQREVIKAEQSLNTLESQSGQTTTAENKVGNATKDLAGDMDKASDRTISFGDVLKANLISDAIVGGVRAIGAAIANVAREAVQLAKGALDSADSLEALSSETGLTTEQLQAMQYVGDDLGVSLDTQTGALSKLVKNMSGAKDGTGTAAEAFKTLGISVTDANGNLRDSNDVYKDALGALSGVGNETERDAMAMALFGKSARELNPLIEAGADGLSKLEAQAYATGAVMSGETVAALDSLGDSVDHLKQSAQTAAGTFVAQFAPALSDVSAGLTGMLSGTVSMDDFMATINTLVTQVVTAITTMLPGLLQAGVTILTSLIQGIISAIPQIIPAVTQIVLQLATSLIQMLPQIIEAGMQVIIQLALGIAAAIPELIPTIVSTMLLIVQTLIENLPMLIEAALQLIMALAKGLLDALPQLIAAIPQIITTLVTTLTNPDMLTQLIMGALTLIVAIAGGLIKALPELIKAVPQIITALVTALGNGLKAMANVGKNLVEGLWDGIKSGWTWLTDKVKALAQGLVDGIKNVLGIHSPSTVFRDEIGKNMALGLGVGFADAMSKVKNDMQSAMPTDFESNMSYAVSKKVDYSSSGSAGSMSDTVGSALLAGLAAIGDAIYDAIPKGHQTTLNGKVIAEETWGDFETTAANKNKIFAASREAIASIARSV